MSEYVRMDSWWPWWLGHASWLKLSDGNGWQFWHVLTSYPNSLFQSNSFPSISGEIHFCWLMSSASESNFWGLSPLFFAGFAQNLAIKTWTCMLFWQGTWWSKFALSFDPKLAIDGLSRGDSQEFASGGAAASERWSWRWRKCHVASYWYVLCFNQCQFIIPKLSVFRGLRWFSSELRIEYNPAKFI